MLIKNSVETQNFMYEKGFGWYGYGVTSGYFGLDCEFLDFNYEDRQFTFGTIRHGLMSDSEELQKIDSVLSLQQFKKYIKVKEEGKLFQFKKCDLTIKILSCLGYRGPIVPLIESFNYMIINKYSGTWSLCEKNRCLDAQDIKEIQLKDIMI